MSVSSPTAQASLARGQVASTSTDAPDENIVGQTSEVVTPPVRPLTSTAPAISAAVDVVGAHSDRTASARVPGLRDLMGTEG